MRYRRTDRVSVPSSVKHSSNPFSHGPSRVTWWPATLAFVAIGAFYALVADQLIVGPRWALPALGLAAMVAATTLRWRGLFHAGRYVAIGALCVITLVLTVSAAYLLQGLITHSVEPLSLLEGGVLLWVSTIVAFGLWYWEVDGGGPASRHMSGHGSTDFLFPQLALDEQRRPVGWMPEYIDYLFLAFNTNTAFSPTDTLVMARRAKVMMMYQSVLSLVCVVVVVARAINSL